MARCDNVGAATDFVGFGVNRPARASLGPLTASRAARSSAAWTLRRSVFSAMGRGRFYEGETAFQASPNVPFIHDGFVAGVKGHQGFAYCPASSK